MNPHSQEAADTMQKAKPRTGTIVWHDLTVPNAEEVRDFYSDVVGWSPGPLDMGGYDDFKMNDPNTGETMAGVCYARGSNANLPPQWLMYITVDDVGQSARRCEELGGEIVDGPRSMGESEFCVIRDPAGAVVALISG